MNTPFVDAQARPEDMAQSRAWVGRFFSMPRRLPISLCSMGKPSAASRRRGSRFRRRRRIDANISETVFEGSDPETRLDMSGSSARSTATTRCGMGGMVHQHGASRRRSSATSSPWMARSTGLRPFCITATATSTARKDTRRRRPPCAPGDALVLPPTAAVPATAHSPTTASCSRTAACPSPSAGPPVGGQLSAGWRTACTFGPARKRPHLRLMPGESIRTPRMTVLSWTGDASRAVNLWRRWYLAHILPRPNGQPLQPLLACAAPTRARNSPPPPRRTRSAISRNSTSAAFALDVWWIDAGWYPCYNKEHERKWWHHRHLGARPRAVPQRPEARIRPRRPGRRRPAGLVRAGTGAAGHQARLWSTRNGCSGTKDSDNAPAEPGQPGMPPVADRPRVPADPGQRHQDLPAGLTTSRRWNTGARTRPRTARG